VNGGPGSDRISGGDGRDVLLGGPGNDVIRAGRDADVVLAGPGRDVVFARDRHRDRIDCGGGRDTAKVDRVDVVRNCERVLRGR
jgi:Ca2+-binding RTX toxin-like protein